MIWVTLVLFCAAAFARYVVPVPAPYRAIAITNFVLFGGLALLFSMLTGGADRGVDALKFYARGPVAWGLGFESIFQADFMYFLSGAIQSVIPLNYSAFNLIGALFMSYVGVAMMMRINPNPSKTILLAWWAFTVMPGVHFWHATFGKEAMQLLAIGCFFGFKSLPLRLGTLVVLLMVRPHIGMLLAAAEVIRIMLGRKKPSDVIVLVVASAVCTFALSYLVERLGGGSLSLNVLFSLLADFGDDWSTSNLRLNDTSSILAYPDFFLRPYPLELRSMAQLFVSVENLLILLFVSFALYLRPRGTYAFTAWLFLVFLCIILPLINPNVGTAARKKQLLPVCCIVVLGAARRRRTSSDSGRQMPLTQGVQT